VARALDEAGKAMRATSQDMDAAAMMGINVNRTISFTFALAGALAGAGGLLYFLHFTSIRYDTGFQIGLIASPRPCSADRDSRRRARPRS
jgi:branched-subunit amino acid ABC-type transport system permease component